MLYADQRWIGNHGIGRFASRVLTGLNYSSIQLSGNPATALDSWYLARALRNVTSEDLFFSPGYNSPLYCRAPFVFTIHDLSHIYCPENSSAAIKLYYATILKRNCHRAAAILTVSEFTRKQIISWSGVSADKVFNVSCGVDSAYSYKSKAYEFPFDYLLCVSNRKEHKNELRLIEAFAKSGVPSDVHLVFTSQSSPNLMRILDRYDLTNRVHFVGNVPEAQLPSLYRGAKALVFPSLYEGFGLPILEAMASGTPVVTSNVTAIPEVAGDAALLVNPTSVEDISKAIVRILTDSYLREHLRENGLSRAKNFSWQNTLAKTSQVLNRLMLGSAEEKIAG